MIYLDNCATTIPDKSVVNSFERVTSQYFANASSIHKLGGEVEQLYVKARQQAANLLHVNESEIIFTSGGTEGNNIAIKGIAFEHQARGKHIITTEIEHASVFNTCQSLEAHGFEVTYLPVNEDGVISVRQLEDSIRDDTILISVMHVNNETGAIQPIEEIGQIAKKYPKLFFHVDAVQSLGKVPLNLTEAQIDLCTYSGHKIHGLKGTGIIYVKDGISLFPLFHGGGQEFDVRSGTENVAGNVSFVRALRLILEQMAQNGERLSMLKNKVIDMLKYNHLVMINTPINSAPHIINLSVPGFKPETVINKLSEQEIFISTQSACSSKQLEKSRVLAASGFTEERAISGLRISLSYHTTEKEIDTFVTEFERVLTELKHIME